MVVVEFCYLRLRLSCVINFFKSGSCRRGDGGFGEVIFYGVCEMFEEKVLGRRRVIDWGRGVGVEKVNFGYFKVVLC